MVSTEVMYALESIIIILSSWSHVDWCNFCIHLRSLNVRYFGTVESTRLKLSSMSPSMA
jgi:hypothetical protein